MDPQPNWLCRENITSHGLAGKELAGGQCLRDVAEV